jgi:hypothetical protein
MFCIFGCRDDLGAFAAAHLADFSGLGCRRGFFKLFGNIFECDHIAFFHFCEHGFKGFHGLFFSGFAGGHRDEISFGDIAWPMKKSGFGTFSDFIRIDEWKRL